MSGVLLAQTSGSDSVIIKDLPPSSLHQISAEIWIPSGVLSSLVSTGFAAAVLTLKIGSVTDGIRPTFSTGWAWNTDLSGLSAAGVLNADAWNNIDYEAIFLSGTTWQIGLVANGVFLFSYNANFGANASAAAQLILGDFDPPAVSSQSYYGNTAFASDAGGIVFEDLPADDFSAWDSTSGDVSIAAAPSPTPAPSATYHSPEWRFVVGDLVTFETLSFLDKLATQRSATFTLNQAASAEGVVPSDNPEINIPWPTIDADPFLTEGSRVLWGLRKEGSPNVWVIRFAGIIMQLEDTAQSDNAYSHYTAYDPWQYLLSRPVCNADGSLPGPNGISFSGERVDVIAATLLGNTIFNQGQCGIDAGAAYGGTGFYDGTIDAPTTLDINFQQGTSVGQAWTQLCNLNICDIVLLPIYDPKNRAGYLCQFNIASQWGSDRDDAIFAWDRPSRSLVGLQRTISGTERANVVKFFAGPGGSATGGQTIGPSQDTASIAKYGQYWRQQFFPSQNIVDVVSALADTQLAYSRNGRTTVVFSPAPERSPIPFTDYYLGDRVPVYASNRFRAPIPQPDVPSSDQQHYERVYGIPVQIGDDSTEQIQQLLTTLPNS